MTEKRFNILKNELDFYFDVNDTEKRWEIGDVELDNLPVFEDLVDLLNELAEENEQLKAQLLYDGDGVCNICKHQYLVETGKYYVAKCEKEHEECSKVDLQYCEDFELVRDFE